MNKLQAFGSVDVQEDLLHRIANRIRQSLELEEILNTSVTEIQAYLGTDRVKIYRSNSDGNGVVHCRGGRPTAATVFAEFKLSG